MQTAKPVAATCDIPSFRAPYAPADEAIAARLLQAAARPPEAEARIDARATRLVEAIRARSGGLGGVEDFLHAYALSTKEGLALMVLAEALLRVPDADTADRLIEDKLKSGDWAHYDSHSTAFLVSASAWTLGITARVIHPGETPEGIVDGLVKRLGLPAVRAATRQAMRLLGSHFVLGQTIDEALDRAAGHREFLYSFDMLGEGARTAADAERYFDAYAKAIAAIGATRRQRGAAAAARHFGEAVGAASALRAAVARARAERADAARARAGAAGEVARAQFHRRCRGGRPARTVARGDRGDVARSVACRLGRLRAGGAGLSEARRRVIDWVADLAEALDRRLMVRLVKGAYWDTEIKRAQERGLADYPVFTRKAMTDLCYLACVRRLLEARPRLYPQFATHNALTVASVIEDAGGVDGYEFQRLHGMGEALYQELRAELPDGELPRLCAGRRLCRSARLSGAAAVGERRQFVLRLGGGRSGGADRRHSAAAAKLDRRAGHRRATRIFRCRAICSCRCAAIPPASNSATAPRSMRLLAEIDAARGDGTRRAADRRRRGRRPRTAGRFADRRQAHRHGGGRRRSDRRRRHGRGAGRLRRLERDADRPARRRARTRRRSDRAKPRAA